MGSFRMFWLLIFILGFIFNDISEAKPDTSAIVVGTVYCDTCFQQDFSRTSHHFISGASVAVECRNGRSSKPSFYKEVKTDKQGKFRVHLPFAVSKHVKRIKRCSVKLISSSEPYCAIASSATSSSLHLKSRKQGTHIFSAGFFTFKPLKEPELCNQKPSLETSKEFASIKTFFPTPNFPTIPPITQNPTLPNLPPLSPMPSLPTLPPLPTMPSLPTLPSLPTMPSLPTLPSVQPVMPTPQPSLPLPPIHKPTNSETSSNVAQVNKQMLPTEFTKRSSSSDPEIDAQTFFFPNPQVPPLLPSPPPTFGGVPLPPNPLQPPALLPPVLPPPILPPIPVLTPPPPPPAFPFPFPPFPFPPVPRFPGIPPASVSKETSP